MEGEMKRRIFAVLEELEVDNEGFVVALAPAEEVLTPVTEETPVMEVVSDNAEEAEVVFEDTATDEILEPVVIEPAATSEQQPVAASEAAVAVDSIGEVAVPKYVNKNFAQKMMLADEVIQDRYDEVKNYALRFKKLKARISKKFESINQGRLQFVKLSVAGKTLKLYLNMDVSETDPKFRCKDMSDKVTYETVPTMLRIKSGRAVRYAKILIDQCAEKYGLVENKKFVEVDAMKVVEDFLAEREARKLAKAGDVDVDDGTEVLEETAVTDEE